MESGTLIVCVCGGGGGGGGVEFFDSDLSMSFSVIE